MKKKAMGYVKIHIYIPAYLYDKIEQHRDILKGRLSAICQDAIEDYIHLNVIPYKELKAMQVRRT